ncbi:MAG: thiamine transport system ATP-binding protein [Ilumatobacteraceae bacterium]|nr:thiamine transport system ATP-binding protein [Ilumatobacteraceae bacterium]
MLDVEGVTVRFGDRAVLRGLSLHVDDAEIVAVLGPSGAGKSTLLRVIAGLLQPDSGVILLDGVDITNRPAHLRNIGMMFQDEQLFPHLDVAGNVAFGPRMRRWSRTAIDDRIDELLVLVGLGGFADRRVDRLSGGEKKRVALARSLAPRPAVLLLDEPLTGLDRELHDRLIGEVGDVLRATNTTAVLVTHDREEAEALAGRVVEWSDVQPGPG